MNIQTNASFPLLPQSRVQKRTQEDVGVYRGKKYLCKKLGVKEGEGCVFLGGGGVLVLGSLICFHFEMLLYAKRWTCGNLCT